VRITIEVETDDAVQLVKQHGLRPALAAEMILTGAMKEIAKVVEEETTKKRSGHERR
jgi:hypothetical protein